MTTLAVQTANGRAVTELSYGFKSMVNCGSFQYGCNSSGIFLLNSAETDTGAGYTSSFTLASSDFGIPNLKRIRFLHIGIETNDQFTVSVMGDDKVWRDYDAALNKTGLQEVRVPVGRDGYGRYWKVKITSQNRFRIDHIDGIIVLRSLGHKA